METAPSTLRTGPGPSPGLGGSAIAVEHPRPLVVDLDGTLVATDMLLETLLAVLGRNPAALIRPLLALRHGKAALKQAAAAAGRFDPAVLPYDDAVLRRIHAARAAGRKVFLATASDTVVAQAIADHLGLFDGVFCSDGRRNLAASAKAEQLVEAFGRGGFDYIGNDTADLPVWREAGTCIAARATPGVERRLRALNPQAEFLPRPRLAAKPWLKCLRVHQYAKNALILTPLFTAHAFDLASLGLAMLAILAFSLAASGNYILNDLIDLGADRQHRSKRTRPLASGRIPLGQGIAAVPVLLASGGLLAALISMQFLAVLLGYLATSMLYSFWLKRVLLVDVVVLALLYVARVIAGAAAIAVPLSHWFLGFALFVFTCLALIKRYIECAEQLRRGAATVPRRAYAAMDAEALLQLAAAAGFNSITVLALYVSSDAVGNAYARPELLWLLCPIMTYWIARVVLLAHRGAVHDDPLVFALTDRASLVTAALAAMAVLIAI